MSASRELRLALSMNGGVSLAVWIAGAVTEIDRVRGGDPFWAELLRTCGYDRCQVDVMAGASAGGLNGVILAETIRRDASFASTLPLWYEHAGIELLVQPHGDDRRAPMSILNGAYFLDALQDALDGISHGPQPARHDLAVFASATLVASRGVVYDDVPGRAIGETRSDAYFHVAKRGPATRGLDGFEPGDDVLPNTAALAVIGRATSSLPALFEPVTIRRSTFGSRLVGAFGGSTETVRIMDGGVIDNVPIARAIRAIYQSRANQRVRRVLVYLHPDPGQFRAAPDAPSASPQAVPPAASSPVAVLQAFLGKRGETLREDIDLLRAHNAAVERRRRIAEELLDSLRAPTDQATERVSETEARDIHRAATLAMLVRAAADPGSELPWHAPNVARVEPILDVPDDDGSPVIRRAELAGQLRRALDRDPELLVAETTRRHAAAVARVLEFVRQEAPDLDLADAMAALDDLLLLCDLLTSYQLFRLLSPGEGGPVERLLASKTQIERLPEFDRNETWAALARWCPEAGDHDTRAQLRARLDRVIEALPEADAAGRGLRVMSRLRTRALEPQQVADVLAPLATEPVASDQKIEFVRATGDVVTPAVEAFLGADDEERNRSVQRWGDRVTGKQLHHLGAFFAEPWRRNDARWGQLDVVPAVLEALLDEDAVTALRASPDCPRLSGVSTCDDLDRDQLVAALVRERQRQLLDGFTAERPDDGPGASGDSWEAITGRDAFRDWRQRDRRIQSELGGRPFTSAMFRAVLRATRVAETGQSRLVTTIVTILRPLVLGAATLVLAGRWAVASLAWTLVALAAPRADTLPGRLVLGVAGLAVVAVTAWIVEGKFRPSGHWSRYAWPYLTAAAGLLAGFAVIVAHDRLVGADVPVLGWAAWWVIPAAAATIGGITLAFWMRWWVCVVLGLAVFAWYGAFAYVAARDGSGRPVMLGSWTLPWIARSLWCAWAVAVIGTPLVISRLPDRWLRPSSPADDPARD